MLPDPRIPRGGRSREEDVSRTTLCGRQGAREVPDGKRRGRPARARPRRRGSPDPIPNSAAKPAIAQSTAEPVRGRTGRRARAGRVRPREGQGARRGLRAPPSFPRGRKALFPFLRAFPLSSSSAYRPAARSAASERALQRLPPLRNSACLMTRLSPGRSILSYHGPTWAFCVCEGRRIRQCICAELRSVSVFALGAAQKAALLFL